MPSSHGAPTDTHLITDFLLNRPSAVERPAKRPIAARFAGRGYLIFTLVGIVALLSAFGLVLHSSYVATEQLAMQSSTSVGALIEQDILRNVELCDLSLQFVIEGLNDPRVATLDPALRRQLLFDRAIAADGLGSILVLDETGNLLLDSRRAAPPLLNLADRNYFQVHRMTPDSGLYISKPFKSRLWGEWSIGISRRLNHKDGSFAGVVVGMINLDYFQSLFQKVSLDKDAAVVLFHTGGVFVARYPLPPYPVIGQKASAKIQLFRHFKEQPSGIYEVVALDGVRRLYNYRQIGNLPLILDVGLSKQRIFAHWQRQALMTSVSLVALCVLVLIMTLRIGRELRRRREVEHQLAVLAATDPLTGIANRRRFDESLASEWTRACRSQRPISLLMIDVDLFKSFNDRFGHQAGDAALRAIACSLRSVVTRQPDLIARYGGEEFVVLLPDTDEPGARHVAETLRQAAAGLDLGRIVATAQKLTVSIGIATRYASVDNEAWKLICDADRALYIAKASGRDRVSSGASSRLTLVPKPPAAGAVDG